MKRTFLFLVALLVSAPAIAQWPGYTNKSSSGGGSGTVDVSGTPTSGQYARWTDADTIEGVALPTLTGTPAAGDLSCWTGAAAQALIIDSPAGSFLRGDSTATCPVWSTLIMPNAMTSGGVLYGSASNTVASSGALTANAFITGGGAGAAPNSVALTGIVQGNGASAPTAITPGTGVATALAQNVSGSGSIVLATAPTLTTPTIAGVAFASRGTATAGLTQRITDVGPAGFGSLWCANGTLWKPCNGNVMLLSKDSASGVSNSGTETVAASLTLPAAMVKNGDRLRFRFTANKSDTSSTCTVRFHLGTAGTIADTTIYTQGGMVTTLDNLAQLVDFRRESATSVQKLGTGVTTNSLNSESATNFAAAVTVTDIDANVMILTISVQLTVDTTPTCSIQDATIELASSAN